MLYAALAVIAIIALSIWVFTIVSEENKPKTSDKVETKFKKTENIIESKSKQEFEIKNTTKNNSLGKKLKVIDLGINSKSEYLNRPGYEAMPDPNETIIRIMYIGNGIREVFGVNLFEKSMPTYLKEGFITNNAGEKISYIQKLSFPNNFTLNNFSDSRFKEGNYTVGFNLSSKEEIITHTITFVKSISIENLTGQELNILGKNYYVQKADSSLYKLQLLESPYFLNLNTEEQTLINYPGEEPFLISIDHIDIDNTILKIENKTTKRLYKKDLYLHKNISIIVDDILADPKSENGRVKLAISPKKIVMEGSRKLKVNSKYIEEISSEFYPEDKSIIDKIKLKWTSSRDTFATYNKSLLMPFFENLEIAMSDVKGDYEDDDEDPYVYIHIIAKTFKLSEVN